MAADTLSGMIRCSGRLRRTIVADLETRFMNTLTNNPVPKAKSGAELSADDGDIRRGAALLGLGALVIAFPYKCPPPEWMPRVVTLLASWDASDTAASKYLVRDVLAKFKKNRLDTWPTDKKVLFQIFSNNLLLIIYLELYLGAAGNHRRSRV